MNGQKAVRRRSSEHLFGARVVRAIYLDKHKDANWKVAWHQDLTIAVREKVDVEGFSAWSSKAGILTCNHRCRF